MAKIRFTIPHGFQSEEAYDNLLTYAAEFYGVPSDDVAERDLWVLLEAKVPDSFGLLDMDDWTATYGGPDGWEPADDFPPFWIERVADDPPHHAIPRRWR